MSENTFLAGMGVSAAVMLAALAVGWLRPPPRTTVPLRLALGQSVSGWAFLAILVAFALAMGLLAALGLAVHELVGRDEVLLVGWLVPWAVPVLMAAARAATRWAGRGRLVSVGRKVELVWDGASRRCPPGAVAERVRVDGAAGTGFLELYLRDEHGQPVVLVLPLAGELAVQWGRSLLAAGALPAGAPDPRGIPVIADLREARALRGRLVAER